MQPCSRTSRGRSAESRSPMCAGRPRSWRLLQKALWALATRRGWSRPRGSAEREDRDGRTRRKCDRRAAARGVRHRDDDRHRNLRILRRDRPSGPVHSLPARAWHSGAVPYLLGHTDGHRPGERYELRRSTRSGSTRGRLSERGETVTEQSAARTAIVTVDDDPGVSRAVARDLRRKYGERYRIVRAESGADALEALRQMKLRGDVVAAILADYRMPGMNGIEFLERAMDIYPGARRVLLTAYADTGAAIDAINVVDLDHYLLKPWDPPEEKLYPVIDALLDAWMQSDHRPVPEIKVVGHRWSARCSEVREFLARNQVPYRWYNSDEPEAERLLEAAHADGLSLPVVITPDGNPLIEPTDAELASRVGLATAPSADFYDLIVIGGGPAGLGAAVYGASEGL